MSSHDESYKLLFSHSQMVADLLQGFVQAPWVAVLDFSTLKAVKIGTILDLGYDAPLPWLNVFR